MLHLSVNVYPTLIASILYFIPSSFDKICLRLRFLDFRLLGPETRPNRPEIRPTKGVLNQEYCQIDYKESIITRDNSLKWAYNSACIGGGRLLLSVLIEDLTLELCYRGEFKIDMIIEQHTCTAQWGKLGGHVDIVILCNLLSNICSYEHLLVFINQV